jgi:hypothetical protein
MPQVSMFAGCRGAEPPADTERVALRASMRLPLGKRWRYLVVDLRVGSEGRLP